MIAEPEPEPEPEPPEPASDEWGVCFCTFDEDGLLVKVCEAHRTKVYMGERLARDTMDREIDQRLHAMFCRTNLGPRMR